MKRRMLRASLLGEMNVGSKQAASLEYSQYAKMPSLAKGIKARQAESICREEGIVLWFARR